MLTSPLTLALTGGNQMTKDELIKALKPYPGNMEIYIDTRCESTDEGFTHILLNNVEIENLPMLESPDDEQEMGTELCIVLEAL